MSKTKKIKPGLGKGLSALIPDSAIDQSSTESKNQNQVIDGGLIAFIEIHKIHRNPYQPREDFDPDALNDLMNSIKEHGLIQPITVRPSINGYELVAGERRLRASTELGLDSIPAYVLKDIKTGTQMLELALIENVQRENLNPIEVAHGYQRLIEECGYTQEEVSKRVGKERSTVTNFLRLLRLPENIQEELRKRKLSTGHARAILALEDAAQMISAGKEVIEKQLSVRATEKLVKDIIEGSKKKETQTKKEIISREELIILEDKANTLRRSFGTQVKITPKSKESGIIEFEFYSNDDLERLLDIFNRLED